MYPYQESASARGLTWVIRALWLQAGIAAAEAGFLGTLVLVFGSAVRQPTLPGLAMSLAIGFGASFVLSEILVGVLFFVGFGRLYEARREYGARHERSVDRAIVWVVLAVVLLLAANTTPLAGPTTAAPSLAPLPFDPIGLVLRAAGALLVAVALFASVAAFVSSRPRRLAFLGAALGVVSSIGQTALMSMGAVAPSAPESMPLAVIGVAVAGACMTVASTVSFALAYRTVRASLLSGTVPRAFPPGWPAPFPPPYRPPGPEPPKS